MHREKGRERERRAEYTRQESIERERNKKHRKRERERKSGKKEIDSLGEREMHIIVMIMIPCRSTVDEAMS